MASFTVAVDRDMPKDKKDQARANGDQTADFIRCVAFNKTAENIGRFFQKGRMIGIEGRIQTGSYTNKEGRTVYTTDVIVRNFSFCGDSGNQNYGQPPQQYQQYPQGGYQPQYQQQPVYQQPPQQQMQIGAYGDQEDLP